MTDIGTGFLRAFEAFLNTRLGDATEEAWRDTGSFLESLTTFSTPTIEAKFNELKTDISEGIVPLAKEIGKKIEKQTSLIGTMVSESATDLESDDFNVDTAARVAIRIGMALSAADEAYAIIATELARDAGGTVDEHIRDELMLLWSPWAKPFKDIAAGASNLVNSLGTLLGIDDLVGELGKVLTLDRSGGQFLLVATLAKSDPTTIGPLTLDQISVETFLQFSDREVANPTEEEKKSLVQRGEKFYIGDVAIFGFRLRTALQPGITSGPLLAKIMPGSSDPKTTTTTAISLDTAYGLYLGDGRKNEKAVLPVRFSFPGVELRELALGLLRNAEREVTGLEITTSIAGTIGEVVGLQVEGSGFIVDLDGVVDHHQMFADLPVSPRWPDAVGLRIDAGAVAGGGFIQRVERTYKVGGEDVTRVEFGGTVQLKVLGVGITAIVILSPDPFSLVLVIGVRFPKAIELGLGFTLNGLGGLLAIDRGIDLAALRAGMRDHILDKMLFPDDPVSAAPKLLDKVAHVFPPQPGGFVIGPIAELGWGSEAKFVRMKVGVILALPDPKVVIVGSLRVLVPHEKAKVVDIHAEVFAAITPDYFLLFATMKGSTIGPFDIDGDLGLYIQWSGEGAFEFSVGGFHPDYEKLTGTKPKLGELTRVTLDFSPGGRDEKGKHKGPIVFEVKLYLAITAGSVQLGVEGRLEADFAVIAARAWVKLDMIFVWAPTFAFIVSLEVGVEVDIFGATIASVLLRGELSGTRPYKLSGRIKVDVWFLPTFDEEVGPIEWGDPPAPLLPAVDILALVRSALDQPEAWKVQLPGHAAQLVSLATVEDVTGILAHPLAAIEVSQSVVPLGVSISHLGAAPVQASMVTMGAPRSTAGDAMAISALLTPFPPGQFFDLAGEQLLARAGFEEMQAGARIAMATTPVSGPSRKEQVAYRTYVRDEQEPLRAHAVAWAFNAYGAEHIADSVVGRQAAVAENPYLEPTPHTPVTLAPAGSSVLTDAHTGAPVLAALGALSSTEAAVIAEAVTTAGLADVTRIDVRG